MPHSSGGGSSSGGSHGSSGVSYGGSDNPRFGNRYYSGSHRYVYYVNNRPRYYFSDTYYTKEMAYSERKSNLIGGVIGLAICLVLLVFALGIHIPRKVSVDYNTDIIIEDMADALTPAEEDKLTEDFNHFREMTGITPAFVSIDFNNDTALLAKDLETYAYRKYVNLFSDEKHWLVVFSWSGECENWEWEGMIGDDCSGMITTKFENAFTESVQEKLWASSSYTVQSAISEAFLEIGKKAQHISIGNADGMGLGAFIFSVCIMWNSITALIAAAALNPETDPKVNSYACPTDKEKPEEVECEYCGSIYVAGIHTNCPNCGAVLKSGRRSTAGDEI